MTRVSLSVVAAMSVAACRGANQVPTVPGPVFPGPSDVLAIEVTCPALLTGETSVCGAVVHQRQGPPLSPVTLFEWSSTRPEVATVQIFGIVTGRSAGESVISASYAGRQGSAVVSVRAEDALRVSSAAEGGEFRPGTTVTMWLQGYYSVASQETARLSLRITDQDGTITTTPPLTVSRGGDHFVLSSTFVVPQTSMQVCRTAILEIGSLTFAEPHSNAFGLWCIPVRR